MKNVEIDQSSQITQLNNRRNPLQFLNHPTTNANHIQRTLARAFENYSRFRKFAAHKELKLSTTRGGLHEQTQTIPTSPLLAASPSRERLSASSQLASKNCESYLENGGRLGNTLWEPSFQSALGLHGGIVGLFDWASRRVDNHWWSPSDAQNAPNSRGLSHMCIHHSLGTRSNARDATSLHQTFPVPPPNQHASDYKHHLGMRARK